MKTISPERVALLFLILKSLSGAPPTIYDTVSRPRDEHSFSFVLRDKIKEAFPSAPHNRRTCEAEFSAFSEYGYEVTTEQVQSA